MKTTQELLSEGYILYLKNDKIETVKPPEYGYVKLIYQNGKLIRKEKLITEQ